MQLVSYCTFRKQRYCMTALLLWQLLTMGMRWVLIEWLKEEFMFITTYNIPMIIKTQIQTALINKIDNLVYLHDLTSTVWRSR